MSVPQTFRTSPDSYAALCGVLSVPPVLLGWGVLFGGRVDLTTPLLIFTSLPTIAAIWLAYFRLRIDDRGIEYRDLFGRNGRL